MITGVIILEQLRLIYMPPSQHLLFAVLRVSRQPERLLWAGHQPTLNIYAWRTPVLDGRPGPFHGAEIAFTFDNAQLCDHYSGGSAEAIVLSRQVSTAWVSFARTGNPNHADLPHWPKYTSELRPTMQFDTPCEVRNDSESQGLKLIAESPLL
jgi:para-nitrobenzyl esterase